MSAASVTAYLSPTIARKRAISSGESGGLAGFAIFMCVTCVASVPLHCGAAQAVVDRFAEPAIRHRHDGDGARAVGVESAKIAEKVGGGLIEIAVRRQIHHYGSPRQLPAAHCEPNASSTSPGSMLKALSRTCVRGA